MRSSKTDAREPREHHTRVAKHEWHALPIPAVLEALSTNEEGLDGEAAAERLAVYGKNRFSQSERETAFARFIRQCKSPLTIVLALALAVTIFFHEYIDAAVIAVALAIAIILGLLQEGKASRAFEKLAHSQVKIAQVIRAGKRHELLSEELVPGDIVLLHSGMQVPADLRIFESKNLSLNEAPLTGEWLPTEKGSGSVPVGTPFAELSSMAHLGTFVAEGYGKGIVVATGDSTAMGEFARELSSVVEEITPVQWEMERLSKIILVVIVTLIIVIFFLGLIAGEEIELMLLTAVAIAVAAIPEGLPAAVTVILAVGMESLLQRGGLVRNLLAAETLGSTTFILTDKTGTLTEARMAVTDMLYEGKQRGQKEESWHKDETAKEILDLALCATDAFLEEHTNGDESYIVRGEPMERAILEAAQNVGIAYLGESARGKREDFLAFESKNRFAAGLTVHEGRKKRLCLNGAPELLLENASMILTSKGAVKLTEAKRDHYESTIRACSRAGKRLIAVSYKDVEYETIPEELGGLLEDTIFAGVIIITDPVRKDVKEAIETVHKAGVQIRLVTGDSPETALSIAREVGIAREHDVAVTGDEMKEFTDEELLEIVRTTRVFARILPRQKMRLASVLQASGEIVAMTGDGINDAAALRKAHIGVAIGSGTEVAKESSDLVLMNDSFSIVSAAIEEGRRIVTNLRKIIGYLFATSLSEAFLIGGALITGGALPILPAQILWGNIIEEGLMSVAFAFEPGEKNAMKENPRDIHEEGVFSREMILFTLFATGFIALWLLSLYAFLRISGVPIEELRSVMFLAISLDSLFIAFSFRSLTRPVWEVPLRSNLFFIGSFVISVVLFALVLAVPFLQYVFSYQPLSAFDFMLIFLYGLLSMVVIEVAKWLFFK